MKKLNLILALILFSASSYAVTITVSGQVTDTNNNPLANYTVWVGESYYGLSNVAVTTNSQGNYTATYTTNNTQGILYAIVQNCRYDSIAVTMSFSTFINTFTGQNLQVCPLGSGTPRQCSNMSGALLAAGATVTDAMVYLYEHDNSGGFLVDSTLCDSLGGFAFNPNNLDSTVVYSIYARLLPADMSYGYFINTYTTNASTFGTADSLTCFHTNNAVLFNVLGTVQGNNYIGGASYRVTRGTEPEVGVRVLLYDNNKVIIDETYSDQDGEYEFADLADGTYYLLVDIPGVEMEFYEVVLSGQTRMDGLKILIEEHMANITDATSVAEDMTSESIRLFPNPTTTKIFLNLEDINFSFEVTDLAGKLILSGVALENSVDVSDLSPGKYLLYTVSADGEANHMKFIKE